MAMPKSKETFRDPCHAPREDGVSVVVVHSSGNQGGRLIKV